MAGFVPRPWWDVGLEGGNMLNCTITIQWSLSFVLIGSEIEKEFLSCIPAPRVQEKSRILYCFHLYPEYNFLNPVPHPCLNFGKSRFRDSGQNPVYL